MSAATTSFSSEHSWLNTSSRRNSIESVYSIQGKETDYVRDTTDTEFYEDEGEYEPVSEPEEDTGLFNSDSSGESIKNIIQTKVIEVKVREDGEQFADSEKEMTDSEVSSDSDLDLPDYWQCVQCQASNNNPLYRYCERCFKVRKNFFPPRPKRHKSKTRVKSDHMRVHKLTDATDSGLDSNFASQDLTQSGGSTSVSGVGTSLSEVGTTLSEVATSLSDVGSSISEVGTSHSNSHTDKPDSSSEPRTNVSYLKRRAESTDNNPKRQRIEYDSDETDIEKQYKKSNYVSPLVKTVSDPSLTLAEVGSEKETDNMCIVCYSEPKSGAFVHGRIAHICCCYKCAVKVWATAKSCPICKCKVSNVLKAVM